MGMLVGESGDAFTTPTLCSRMGEMPKSGTPSHPGRAEVQKVDMLVGESGDAFATPTLCSRMGEMPKSGTPSRPGRAEARNASMLIGRKEGTPKSGVPPIPKEQRSKRWTCSGNPRNQPTRKHVLGWGKRRKAALPPIPGEQRLKR